MAKDRRELMNPQTGLFKTVIHQAKLIIRLMGDKQVNFFLKLLPVAAAIYVLSPVDLFPGLALPIIGVIDDAAVLWLGTTLFVSLCPDEIVQKHADQLEKVVRGNWRDAPAEAAPEVIDAKVMDAKEEPERLTDGGSE